MGVLHDPALESLLARLHAKSDEQTQAIREHYDERDGAVDRSPDAYLLNIPIFYDKRYFESAAHQQILKKMGFVK